MKGWLKIIVVSIIILMLVASYSVFFIDFSSLGRNDQQDFVGPSEHPPSNFQEPTNPPSITEPTQPPPSQ